mmetsp:Transcript_22467/g.38344  ORF Transcript_22467/g.38344 Transcript_22467/m.38344 type:complete len:203 (-) Transcript_22467:458-1066(-)
MRLHLIATASTARWRHHPLELDQFVLQVPADPPQYNHMLLHRVLLQGLKLRLQLSVEGLQHLQVARHWVIRAGRGGGSPRPFRNSQEAGPKKLQLPLKLRLQALQHLQMLGNCSVIHCRLSGSCWGRRGGCRDWRGHRPVGGHHDGPAKAQAIHHAISCIQLSSHLRCTSPRAPIFNGCRIPGCLPDDFVPTCWIDGAIGSH